jgi:predicted nucleic acid-binding Zn ribbon protein
MDKIKKNCTNCQSEVYKTVSEIKKSVSGNVFCSKSCSASYNNKGVRRHGKTKSCKSCGEPISNRNTYCSKECMRFYLGHNLPTTTLDEIHESLSVKGKHPSWKNSVVRNNNRIVNKELTKLNCANCDYELHVELCHVKPLSSFDGNATLAEVNSRENVIQLCRNCHWELDNGFLKLG